MMIAELYRLNSRDKALLESASVLLRKAALAGSTTPAELMSVAKMQHVLSRLPRVTQHVAITVSVVGPRRKFGEIETFHWWDICVAEGELSVSSGGHFHRPSTGGDSFTTMNWLAIPGEAPEFDDYLETLTIVPDVKSFADAVSSIDFTAEAYNLKVEDSENPFLQEEEEEDVDPNAAESADFKEPEQDVSNDEDEEENSVAAPWSVLPVNDDEVKLMFLIVSEDVIENSPQFAFDLEDCGGCGKSPDECGLFIDRASPRSDRLVASLRKMFRPDGRRGRLGQRSTVCPEAQQRLAHGGGLPAERRLVITRNHRPPHPFRFQLKRFSQR
jgi:hypothetical protein